MDDDSEYDVFDDIIFDEQALATLDQQERKLLGKGSHVTSTSEPVNKRFRTSNGWTPGSGVNIDYDEMPEISLQRDGSYGVGNPVNALTVSTSKLAERKSERSVSSENYPVTFGTDFLRGLTLPQNMLSGPSTSRQTLYANHQKHTSNGGNSRTTSFRRIEPTVNNVGASTTNSRQLQDQMLELQKELNELREENFKIQTALQDAIDVKLAKEGEVTILRKSIEKTSQSHAAQITQLQAEKEKADLKQAQMQKEMKDELERLRTQFVFKQQELESSIRKPMGSVRGKKAFREPPSTPLPIPYAMRSWNAANSGGAMEDNPVRPSQVPLISKITPSKYPHKSPEKQKKSSMLPGFQNAFETSTPMRSPSKRLNKGKGKMEYGPLTADAPFYNTSRGLSQQSLDILQLPPEAEINSFQESRARLISPSPLTLETSQTKDEDMDTVAIISDESEEAPIPLDFIEDINWKLELSRIILTYSHPAHSLTIFQHLLGLAGSVGSDTKYTASCGKILEVLASSSSKADDYEESLHSICRSLLLILVIINETQQFDSLAMLLDLLRELILSLPKFRVILICSRVGVHNEGDDTFLLDILSKIIVEHVQPMKMHIYRDTLAKEVLSLLESLCFSASPEVVEKLESILRNREVLMILMHISQPAWLLDQSSRLLVLLSTHHTLFRAFLNIPNSDIVQNTGMEMTRDPLIERLCSHLIETGGSEPEAYKLQILTCFAQLSIAHSDAHAALTTSYVIPSLVLFVTQLTTPLWEDDGKLSSSPNITSSIIRTLNQSVMLLYSLIFRTEPALNLRHMLQNAPHRPFNSISNIFVVTFGRLSYCDSPGWIYAERRQELETLSEMAREILEVVVDGPEGDNVWAAFQTEPEEDGALDDEEIEARRLGVEA